MKQYYLLAIFVVLPRCMAAQETVGTDDYLPMSTSVAIHEADSMRHGSMLSADNDSLVALPAITPSLGYALDYPCGMYNGLGDWNLHKGLNASLGMSVTVGLGGDSYSGAGFSQTLALMYATDITNRLSIAVGGYFNHLDWNGARFNDVGLNAILGYHIDERWDAYVYAQKSLSNPNMPRYLRYVDNHIGDRIGAMVSYKLSPSATISVSVEAVNDRRGR